MVVDANALSGNKDDKTYTHEVLDDVDKLNTMSIETRSTVK